MIVFRIEVAARLFRCLGALFPIVACIPLGEFPEEPSREVYPRLDLDKVSILDLSVGPAVFDLELARGQALIVDVDQRFADVTLMLYSPSDDPRSRRLAYADLPTGRVTAERLCFVASEPGDVRLRILAGGDVLGPTQITATRRVPEPEDSSCFAALQLAAEATAERSGSRWEGALTEADKAENPGFALGIRLTGALSRLDHAHEGNLRRARHDEMLYRFRELLDRAQTSYPDSAPAWRRQVARLLIERSRLDEAEALIKEMGEGETAAVGRAERFEILGRLELYRSRAVRAERWFERAAEAWRQTDMPEQGAETWANWAASLAQQSRLEEADRVLREGFALVTDGAVAGQRALLMQRGWLSMLQGAPEQAVDAYRQGLSLMTDPRPSLEKAGFLARWASAEGMAGREEEAVRLYREALTQLPDPNGLWATHIRKSLGDLESRAGRSQQARELLASAEEGFRAHGDENGQAHTWASLGWVEHRDGRLPEAIDSFEKAAEIGDALWLRAYQEGDLVRPTSLMFDIDAHLVDLLLVQAERDGTSAPMHRAFVRSDQARARNLESLLQMAAASDEARSPDLRPPMQPLEIGKLQQDLPDGTVLLSYVIGADRSHLLVLSRDVFRHHVLPDKSSLVALADAWRYWLGRRSSQQHSMQERSVAAKLSRILLHPVRDLIDDANRLIVVPEGPVAEIPIEVLPISQTEVLNERREVLRGPSVGVLFHVIERRRHRQPPTGNISVFADPVYSLSDSRCDDACARESALKRSTAPEETRKRPPRLPATKLEAEAFERWAPKVKTRIYSGFEASLAAFEAELRRRPTLIHLATHSHIDPGRPTRSGLWLSNIDAQGQEIPGFLDLDSIRNLKLDADLVVLSACESAWEEGVRGDGLVGFAQAFIQAGASNVLVSLWPVEDLPTALLMSELYRLHWVEGLPLRRALPKAQSYLRSMERYEAPYYWAGFVLFGGWDQ